MRTISRSQAIRFKVSHSDDCLCFSKPLNFEIMLSCSIVMRPKFQVSTCLLLAFNDTAVIAVTVPCLILMYIAQPVEGEEMHMPPWKKDLGQDPTLGRLACLETWILSLTTHIPYQAKISLDPATLALLTS